MGNNSSNQYQLTDENLMNAEMRVLLLSGLRREQIEVKDVPVGQFKGETVYIHTVICDDSQPKYQIGQNQKPVLVLIHGWGGSGPLFFKIIKQLAERYRFILVDVPGMGASSRPANYDCNRITPEESIDYFVNYFEEWRKEMQLSDFYLAGHSFGGYIAGCWAVKHPENFKKLLLLSPIGCKRLPREGDEPVEQDFEKRFQGRQRTPPKVIQYLLAKAHKYKVSPLSVGRFAGRSVALKLIGNYVDRRQKVESAEQRQAVIDYMYQIFMRRGTTEYSLAVLFELTLTAKIPLGEDEMLGSPEFAVPFSFIFGDGDWVRSADQGFSENLINERSASSNRYRFQLVPNSDHNMHMDNPEGFARCIIQDIDADLEQISAN